MSDSGWKYENLKEYYAERDKRALSEQERTRAAKGFAGALAQMAAIPGAVERFNAITGKEAIALAKLARKPRVRGVAPKEDRTYEGRVYHSKNEMIYAAKLDLLLKAGAIQRVEPQWRIPLRVNDQLVCTMIVDFLVVNNDGSREYHEVKGMESDVWKLKRKLLKACRPDINYVVVKV